MRLHVREWIAGARVASCETWDEAYATRDRLQVASLSAGMDLLERRYGGEVEPC
jgi:hypothetical protein